MKKIYLFIAILLVSALPCIAQDAISTLPDGDYKIQLVTVSNPIIDSVPLNKDVIKKGAAISKNDWSSHSKEYTYLRNRKLNIGWYYSWGPEWYVGDDSLFVSQIEFVPMLWGTKKGDFTMNTGIAAKNSIQWEIANNKIKYLLGFNEPDNANNANMTPQEAIDLWPNLMSFNIPLGSPAPAAILQDGGIWLDEFLRLAKEKNYRVDFLCLHAYPQSAEALKNVITKTWEKYKMPIWITEFCLQDPKATETIPNKFNDANVIAFMADVLPWLDAQPYVKRYSWFCPITSIKYNLSCSQIFYDNSDILTPVGVYYANHKSVSNK